MELREENKREFRSKRMGTVVARMNVTDEWWEKMLRNAEKNHNEAFKMFHRWYFGMMDPEEEARYTDAVMAHRAKLLASMKMN